MTFEMTVREETVNQQGSWEGPSLDQPGGKGSNLDA